MPDGRATPPRCATVCSPACGRSAASARHGLPHALRSRRWSPARCAVRRRWSRRYPGRWDRAPVRARCAVCRVEKTRAKGYHRVRMTAAGTMRAMVMHKHGGPEVLTYETAWPKPVAGPGEIVVQVKAVSYTHLRAHETPEHLVCRLL